MNGTDTPADGTSGASATIHAALDGLGPLARQLGQIHTRLWHEQVHQDLTGPQFTVLGLLRTHGPMDQGTLGTLASLDKSTAAPMLERLKRRGLVTITKDDKDRRRKLVTVTDMRPRTGHGSRPRRRRHQRRDAGPLQPRRAGPVPQPHAARRRGGESVAARHPGSPVSRWTSELPARR